MLRGGGGWPGLKWPQDGGEGLRGGEPVLLLSPHPACAWAGQVPVHGSHGPEASTPLLAALLPPLQRRAFQTPGVLLEGPGQRLPIGGVLGSRRGPCTCLQTSSDCCSEHVLHAKCGASRPEADHSCAVSRLPQERVSSIHPQDLMQIVSHMDSRDKHRVRGCGLRVGLDLHPVQGGRRPHAARLSASGVSGPWMLSGFLAPAPGGQWRPHGEMHAGRGPGIPSLASKASPGHCGAPG